MSAFIGARIPAISIPDTVSHIGNYVFQSCSNLTSVFIGSGVKSIYSYVFEGSFSLTNIEVHPLNNFFSSKDGVLFNKTQSTLLAYPPGKAGAFNAPSTTTTIALGAFTDCPNLTSLTFEDRFTSIRDGGIDDCSGLTNVTLPYGTTYIGSQSFSYCRKLPSIALPATVTNIGGGAFSWCSALQAVYCEGDAPIVGDAAFQGCTATVYYLPGTSGWSNTFAGLPTVLWNPQPQTADPTFGVRTNQFGFPITGTSNLTIVVEASTSLANPAWCPVATNTLTTGSAYFSDPQWTNSPSRFYRLRSP